MSAQADRLGRALVRLLRNSVADGNLCSCYPNDQCPECEAMMALGLGRWVDAESAGRLLTEHYGDGAVVS